MPQNNQNAQDLRNSLSIRATSHALLCASDGKSETVIQLLTRFIRDKQLAPSMALLKQVTGQTCSLVISSENNTSVAAINGNDNSSTEGIPPEFHMMILFAAMSGGRDSATSLVVEKIWAMVLPFMMALNSTTGQTYQFILTRADGQEISNRFEPPRVAQTFFQGHNGESAPTSSSENINKSEPKPGKS